MYPLISVFHKTMSIDSICLFCNGNFFFFRYRNSLCRNCIEFFCYSSRKLTAVVPNLLRHFEIINQNKKIINTFHSCTLRCWSYIYNHILKEFSCLNSEPNRLISEFMHDQNQ